MASKYGWLLLERPVCFYNIHSNRIIILPPLGLMNYEHVVKARFTAPPTSPRLCSLRAMSTGKLQNQDV